jgi:hypothetical protein
MQQYRTIAPRSSLGKSADLLARAAERPPLREYVLGELRCAALRARLAAADIDTIGVALNSGMIEPQTALEWLADAGAFDYVEPTPSTGAVPREDGVVEVEP